MIGTPAYGGMVHVDYLRGLFEYTAQGVRFELMTIGNESLITRARNTILSQFYLQSRLTHLLFLDADVHLPVDGLKRMLAANVPVIGAPVALKSPDDEGNRIWNITRSLGAAGRLIKVENIGTAALMLSRKAVAALVEDAKANGRAYHPHRLVHADAADILHYDVFQVGVKNGVYLSEDYWACQRLRSLGFDILIDPSVVTTHHGMVDV